MTNSFNLNGKVIIVTGAAGLMGVQHCEAILSQNGIPILLDLDLRRLQKLKLKIDKKFATDVQIFAVDITSETEIESCCRSLVKKFNNIHGLINNASTMECLEKGTQDF